MKYLSYFENQDQAMSYDGQLGAPHVAYVEGGEQLLFAPYTEGVEEVKFKFENGQLTLQGEVDPAPGFVDLGLSVMWAECNLGASSPEETGLFYSWGEVEGHRLSADGVTFEDGHVFSESTSVYQSGSKDLTSINDAVSAFYKDQYYPLEYRMPTASQVQELLDNTTHTREIYNGIEGWRFTSSINGNSIFIPSIQSFAVYLYYRFLWTRDLSNVSSYNTSYACAYGEYTVNSTFDIRSYGDSDLNGLYKWSGHQIRGVCNYPPTVPYLSLDEKTTCVSNKENIFAIAANKDIQLVFDQAVSGQIDISEDSNFSSYKSFAIPHQGSLYLNAVDLESDNQYMYIRIVPLENVAINSASWSDPYPLTRTFAVRTVGSFSIDGYNYRLPYAEIKGRELQITNTSPVTIYLNVVVNPQVSGGSKETTSRLYASGSIKTKNSVTISSDQIASWEENIEDHGFVYLKRYSNTSGSRSVEISII